MSLSPMTLSLLLAAVVAGQPCSPGRGAPLQEPGEAPEGEAAQEQEDAMTLTLEDDGTRLAIAEGEVVTLKLACAPGTGFSWQIAKPPAGVEDGLLEQVGESYFEPAKGRDEEETLGGAEVEVLRFQARRAGTGSLELHYRRAWEEAVEPQKVFRLTVEVRASPDGD